MSPSTPRVLRRVPTHVLWNARVKPSAGASGAWFRPIPRGRGGKDQ